MKETKNTTWQQKLSSISSLKREVRSIFYLAKKYHYSHDKILENLKKSVYFNTKYTTLPKYLQAEIRGYILANFDLMYELLEWVHWYNGKFVGKDLPYGDGFKQELIDESSHVYKGTQDKY